MNLELFVARRYLKAKRKQAVISVITGIAVLGVAAGVTALIIALALNTGFQVELQSRILGATSHVSLLQSDGRPIEGFSGLIDKFHGMEGVEGTAPTIYGQVFFVGAVQSQGIELKGIDVTREATAIEMFQRIVAGDARNLLLPGVPGIVIGKELSRKTGAGLNSFVRVIAPEGELSPLGKLPHRQSFKVMAIFESGLWDFDANWAFVSLSSAQQLFHLKEDQVTAVEFRVRDIYRAAEMGRQIERRAGEQYQALTWIELNKPLFSALRLEKLAMFVAIGLIVLVASLNIVTTLIMMVMEKHKDIAIITAMGGTSRMIMSVFVLQGVIIGVIGTTVGAVLGTVTSWFLNRYKIIHLAPDVYSIPYVPFYSRWQDVVAVCVVAILVSFLATLYPARSAARLDPIEALRYE
ncbi:MAG: ABC transporter permease [Acidobacteria bacterium]|nr:ABC transporter permease [Acidobacteriota bacterium]